jgi:hypothetical protein
LQGPKGAIFWWKNTKNGFKIMKTFRLKYWDDILQILVNWNH